jgi:DNA (cytosine-5)-methyltransferase 1
MNDFIATIHLDVCEDPETYKKMFIQEIYRKKCYRPISAQDAKRLQGFPEWFQSHESESTAKHQFGNSVSLPVIYHLAESLLKLLH